MKPFITVLFVFLIFSNLTGCQNESSSSEEIQKSVAKPVKLFIVKAAENEETLFFPAKVEAVRQVNLTFEVDGKVANVNLLEGKKFKKGDLLASLNTDIFKRKLKESRLSLKDAKTELDRIKKVDKKGYASQQSVTKAETAYDLAQVRVENALADLGYSEIYAPFDGTVSRRLVEENTYVSRGVSIAELQDLTKVYFAIDVSERLISEIKGQKILSAKAKLNNIEQTEYLVFYAEHEATTNPVTQTYKVYFGMPYPNDNNINLGSHASLFITLDKSPKNNFLKIPLSSVLTEPNGQSFVWVYLSDKQTAEKFEVLLGQVHGDFVEVEKGLSKGDRVVVSGANKIKSGDKLKPFLGEQ